MPCARAWSCICRASPRETYRAAELLLAVRRLTELRALYFGGTAESARLQASDLEERGDPNGAESALHAYIAARPSDPEGHLAMADFHVRRRVWSLAEASWQRAAAVLIQTAPADTQRLDVAGRVGSVAGLLLKSKLMALGLDRSCAADIEILLMAGLR